MNWVGRDLQSCVVPTPKRTESQHWDETNPYLENVGTSEHL